MGRNRVARLMRASGLSGCCPKSRRSTTRRDLDALRTPNLLDRCFLADAPDKLWLADITFAPTLEGWLYLAFVLDAYSRRVVGWSMAEHMRAELVVDALSMAVGRRNPGGGSSTTRTGERSTHRWSSARGSNGRASCPRWAAVGTRTTTRWRSRSSRPSSAS